MPRRLDYLVLPSFTEFFFSAFKCRFFTGKQKRHQRKRDYLVLPSFFLWSSRKCIRKKKRRTKSFARECVLHSKWKSHFRRTQRIWFDTIRSIWLGIRCRCDQSEGRKSNRVIGNVSPRAEAEQERERERERISWKRSIRLLAILFNCWFYRG